MAPIPGVETFWEWRLVGEACRLSPRPVFRRGAGRRGWLVRGGEARRGRCGWSVGGERGQAMALPLCLQLKAALARGCLHCHGNFLEFFTHHHMNLKSW